MELAKKPVSNQVNSLGRSFGLVPFGYVKNDEGILQVDIQAIFCEISTRKAWSPFAIARFLIDTYKEVGILTRTFTIYSERFGIRAVSNKKKCQSYRLFLNPATINYWIINPVLRGHATNGWMPTGDREFRENGSLLLNVHPRIMDEEEFQQIKELIRKARILSGNSWKLKKSVFSGLLHCSDCGSLMIHDSSHKGFGCKAAFNGDCLNNRIYRNDELFSLLSITFADRSHRLFELELSKVQELSKSSSLNIELEILKRIDNPSPYITQTMQNLISAIRDLSVSGNIELQRISRDRDNLLSAFGDRLFWLYLFRSAPPRYLNSLLSSFCQFIWLSSSGVSFVDFF